MNKYNHKIIEGKWQKKWAEDKLYISPDKLPERDNYYLLTEFPYPSGNLHVGHWYAFSVPDILARYMRMNGKNVLYPIGFDAFGLPAENAAIKNKLNPRIWTEKNMEHMRKQLDSMGASFDWSREVITCDPKYYKWTQWLFLQLFKRGLVYRKETAVNWCPNCKTVLANEQVIDGRCERCDTEVTQKEMLQWNIKITEYADRLLADLEGLDWPKEIKESQKNWIGRSEGAEIDFSLAMNGGAKRIVLLHGKGGSPEGAWKPWLKHKLEALGYEVQVPALPNSEEPNDDEQADYVEKHCTFDENTIIVGHSFGGIVALRLLERGARVKRVVLIGTPFSDRYKDGKKRETVSAALKKGFDFNVIRERASFVALYDTDDHVVPVEDGEAYVRELNCLLMKAKAEVSHFNGDVEPDVFSAVVPSIRVFTTRPDTLYGATYLVLAPEHPWMSRLLTSSFELLENTEEVKKYVEKAKRKTELERMTEQKDKTGVCLEGVSAINPATGERIPMFVADYVLGHYGTGAIMAVPAHDQRDYKFAQKFGLPIREVITGGSVENEAYTGSGTLVNSTEFEGLPSDEAKRMITERFGRAKTRYKLRDWIVSRQRYWGVPIPIIHCKKCALRDSRGQGVVPVPDAELPVVLPETDDYLPEGTGKSPLAKIRDWAEVKCPQCGGKGERETDTLDTFVDSSWYFLRYTDPKNGNEFAAKEKQALWMPVDLYSGGAEHTTMHVLYSRFWHKALYDLGLVADAEPYVRRRNRSLILGPDGQKMSKSRGNVIDPDDVVERLGADTVRLYLAFIGPFNEVSSYPWNPDGVVGVRRFLERIFRASELVREAENPALDILFNSTLKKTEEDIREMKFNTAISTLMIMLNAVEKEGKVGRVQWETFLKMLAPFAPHAAEELWHAEHETSVHAEAWPAYDPDVLARAMRTIVVQVNGKRRAEISASPEMDDTAVEAEARSAVAAHLEGKTVQKTIVVPGRLVNFVVR